MKIVKPDSRRFLTWLADAVLVQWSSYVVLAKNGSYEMCKQTIKQQNIFKNCVRGSRYLPLLCWIMLKWTRPAELTFQACFARRLNRNVVGYFRVSSEILAINRREGCELTAWCMQGASLAKWNKWYFPDSGGVEDLWIVETSWEVF